MELRRDEAGAGRDAGENVHSYWSAAASAAVAVEEIEAGPTIITVRRSRPSESRSLGGQSSGSSSPACKQGPS